MLSTVAEGTKRILIAIGDAIIVPPEAAREPITPPVTGSAERKPDARSPERAPASDYCAFSASAFVV
jgi:hypothetical protein